VTTVSTELTLPYSSDRTVLAVQDTIDRFQWRVLEMSTTRIVIDLGALNAMHTYNFPKMTVLFKELDGQTRLSISVSLKGDLGTSKKRLTGQMGQFVNSVSLRVQTNSIAINPTVAIGEGQGDSQSPGTDRVAQLIQLKTLLDGGALTQDEFEQEKRRILGQG
jgi:Short C-terminal domain